MKATAFIVGPLDGPGAALRDMAQQLEFLSVAPYAGLAQAEHQSTLTPMCFFLFAAVSDVTSLRGVADAIRFSSNRRVRFCPLIYFSESPQVETISRCINMGFDDVITMPFTLSRVRDRIGRQLGQRLTYYETAGYFGPDRRDPAGLPKRSAEPQPGSQFRRIEIIRSLTAGVSVVRDDPYPLQAG